MKMNRRNALLGLGAIATGGGALFGSGAFSTVEAERNVSISAAGDGSANVNLSVDSSSSAISATSGDTISIDGSNLNLEGTTRVNQVLTIGIDSAASSDYAITILGSIGGSNVAKDTPNTGSSADDIQLISNASASSAGVTDDTDGSFSAVSPGETVVFDLYFNLRDDTATADPTIPWTNNTIVVEAV